MSCQQTILDYGLRSLGYGERLLPKSDFTLCQHFTLIGSGLIWNIYFGALALLIGFFIANAMAFAQDRCSKARLSENHHASSALNQMGAGA